MIRVLGGLTSAYAKPFRRTIGISHLKTVAIMASDAFPPAPLKAIANEVAVLLKEGKETVAVAETVSSLSQTYSP